MYVVIKVMLGIGAFATIVAALFAAFSAYTFWDVNPTVAFGNLFTMASMFALAALCEGCRALIQRLD